MSADPRRVQEAKVLVDGIPAATLSRGDGHIVFAYRQEYLASPGYAVATTLPKTDEPVITVGGALPPFFSGLLPEGRRLTGLRAAVKTSADDELSLLLAVGEDPVGNVQILPSGEESTGIGSAPTAVDGSWGDIDFALLAADSGIDLAALAGVQDKVSGRMLTVEGRDDSLPRKHWLHLAKRSGLPRRAADRALEEVLTVTADVEGLLPDSLPMATHSLKDVRRVLRRRREGMLS